MQQIIFINNDNAKKMGSTLQKLLLLKMLKELKLKPTLNLNGNDKKSKECSKKGMVEGLRFELHNGENPRFRYSSKDDTIKKGEEEPGSIYEFSTCYEKILFIFGLLISVICGFFHPAIIKLYGDFLTLLIGRFTEGYVIEVPKLTGFLGAGQWRPNLTHDEQMEFLVQDVKAYAIVSFTASFLQFIFSYLMITFLSYFALKKVGRMKEYFLESLIQQEVSWHDQQNSGSGLASAMAELDTLKNGFNENLGMVIYLTSTFIVNVIVSFYIAWKLTLILIAVAIVFVGIAALASRQKSKLFLKESESCKQAIAIAYEVLSSIRTVTAFGGEEKEADRFKNQSLNSQKLSVRISIFSGLGNGVTWMLMYLYYTTCMWWATPQILADRTKLEKEYSPGTVATVLFCMTIGIINVGLISPYIESLVKARIAANNIYKVLKRKSKINPFSNDGKIINGKIGTIQFRNVHFNYPTRPNVKVLQGLDLEINQGESVALVGPSGCGKSTTIQLLERFYDPDSGSVLVDGIDVRELRLSWLRRQIGLVGQEPVLFNTTVAKNICGDLTIPYEDMIKAAKEANVHEFISSLPQGYDTMVGEGGSSFSGGQKQRIAIARALVRNPCILLLDEATSALDVASEAIVQNALDKASKGRTTITVAHRLSSIQNADRIIVIHEGRLIEAGTHTQLMEKQGKYYSLVSADATLQENLKNKAISNVNNNNNENPADILLEPNLSSDKVDDIAPESTNRPSWRRLWQLNKPELWYIVFGSIGALCVGVTSPVNALLFGTYNAVLSHSDENYVLEVSNYCAIYFLLLAVFTFLSMFMQFSLLGTAGARLTNRLRSTVFTSMLKQEMTWFDDDRNSVGVLTTRLNSDTNTVQDATGSKLGAMMQAVGVLIIGAIISLFYSWKMTLACLVAVPVICASLVIESTIASKANNKTRHYIEQASKVAIEAMSNIRTIASLNLESHVLKRFNKRLTESRKSEVLLINIRGIVFALGYSAVNLSYTFTIAYSVYLIIKEDVPYVNTIIVAETILYGTWLVCQLLTLAPNVSAGKDASGRLFSIIDRKPQLYNPLNDTGKLNSSGDVTYSEVQFAYPKRLDTTILKGLDLKILKGQTVALVGLSGSGKSTCVQLLQRFYDPISGTISINGADVTQVSLHRLRAELGIVSQEPVLFDRTISENIAYGDNSRDVPLTEIIDAAKKANVHDFIISLPAGYETRLGSRGMQLSGGQKQRIAIARALIRNPSILILDEATSALDTQNEKIVQEALETAMKGRTCIMIAHRLSTVQRCDVIYVMSHGEVVESGTHSELLQLNNHYAQLLKQQS